MTQGETSQNRLKKHPEQRSPQFSGCVCAGFRLPILKTMLGSKTENRHTETLQKSTRKTEGITAQGVAIAPSHSPACLFSVLSVGCLLPWFFSFRIKPPGASVTFYLRSKP